MSNERHEFAIIGGGPAGMAAAITAARLGLDTILLDEQGAPGGQIYRNIEQISRDGSLDVLGEEYRRGAELAREFRASKAIYRPSSTVWQAAPDGRIGVTAPRGRADHSRGAHPACNRCAGAAGRRAGMDIARRDGRGRGAGAAQGRRDGARRAGGDRRLRPVDLSGGNPVGARRLHGRRHCW